VKLLLAGDSHGDANYMQKVINHACLLEADAIFQLGDWGLGFGLSQRKISGEQYDTFTYHVSKFATLVMCPVYFLPGNHENYDYLEQLLPTLKKRSNDTYELEPNVYFVPRGTIIEFGGIRFLVCGGATSVDQDYRTPHVSYWQQELITDEDVAKCKAAGPADVVLTHDFPIECTVIDRHLSPGWGEKAQREVIQNRTKVSEILDASGASFLFHGHLHKRYDEFIETASGNRVLVKGLACNMDYLEDAIYLLDTEDLSGIESRSQ